MDPEFIIIGSVLVGIGAFLIQEVMGLRKSVVSDNQKVQALLTDIRDRLGKEKKDKDEK